MAWKTSFGISRARHRRKVAPLRGSHSEMNGVVNDLVAGGRPGAGVSARRSLRDGLTGGTPGSDPGGRGSIPCPGSRASSSAGTSACLTHRRPLVRLQPRSFLVAVAQPVERPLEARGAAGSIPAGHIAWLRSSTRQSTRLLIGRLQVRRLPVPSGRTAIGAVSRFENGWVRKGLGGSIPSPSSWRHGRAVRQRLATA